MSILRRIQGGDTPNTGNNGSAAQPRETGPITASGGLPPRRIVAPNGTGTQDTYQDLKNRVQAKLLSGLDPTMDVSKTNDVRRTIQELFEQILNEESIVLSRPERSRLFEQIAAEILGFGPLQTLLEDETVTEIMVNGPKNIYVERAGKIHRVPVSFETSEHVMRIIDRIVSPLGRRVDESSPYVDARLPDGSRVNVVIPPISLVGPVITIRKFAKKPITVEQMVQFGSLNEEAVEFLKACVQARLNIVIRRYRLWQNHFVERFVWLHSSRRANYYCRKRGRTSTASGTCSHTGIPPGKH